MGTWEQEGLDENKRGKILLSWDTGSSKDFDTSFVAEVYWGDIFIILLEQTTLEWLIMNSFTDVLISYSSLSRILPVTLGYSYSFEKSVDLGYLISLINASCSRTHLHICSIFFYFYFFGNEGLRVVFFFNQLKPKLLWLWSLQA